MAWAVANSRACGHATGAHRERVQDAPLNASQRVAFGRMRDRELTRRWYSRASAWRGVRRHRLEFVVPVTEPMVLVSQVQRSGGTLMSQLFDGHPELHAHPDELYIGFPDKRYWPELDLSAKPSVWFEQLRERPADVAFRRGYRKYGRGSEADAPSHPFILPLGLQRNVFAAVCPHRPRSDRAVLNAYF